MFASFAALVVLTACHSPGATPRPNESALEILVPTEAETLDPRTSTDSVSVRLTRLTHAGLFRLDETSLSPKPYVAESFVWETPLVLRVRLRSDVRFSEGKLLSPGDVVTTLAAFAAPTSRHRRVVDAIDRAEVAGANEVRIFLRRAHATLLTDLELPILRADEAEGPLKPDGQLDGLGPYRIAERGPGVVRLSARDGGVLPKPAHDLVVRTVRDENARAMRMQAGSADIAVNAFSPTLLPTLEKAGLTVRGVPAASLTYITVRFGESAVSNVAVRRALSLLVDRDRIVRTLFAGKASCATTVLPAMHWASDAQSRTPDATFSCHANVEAAVATLRAAGFKTDGSDPRLHFELLTSTDRFRGAVARFLAQEAREAGIVLDVVPLELGTMLSRLSLGNYELATLQMPEVTEPNAFKTFLHSAWTAPSGSNRGRYASPELDAILDEGERTTGEEARRAIYRKMEAHIRRELPLIPLWHEDHTSVTSARAKAFVPSVDGRWLSLASVP
ncbi:MAG: ABC transporter substrate-binding protein [Polyangiaceae bacterium]